MNHRPFYPPSREGHRRPYAQRSTTFSRTWARRNRMAPTIPALIARSERKMRDGRVAA